MMDSKEITKARLKPEPPQNQRCKYISYLKSNIIKQIEVSIKNRQEKHLKANKISVGPREPNIMYKVQKTLQVFN